MLIAILVKTIYMYTKILLKISFGAIKKSQVKDIGQELIGPDGFL